MADLMVSAQVDYESAGVEPYGKHACHMGSGHSFMVYGNCHDAFGRDRVPDPHGSVGAGAGEQVPPGHCNRGTPVTGARRSARNDPGRPANVARVVHL